MLTFPDIMAKLPSGSYNLGQLLTHFPNVTVSRVALARLLGRCKGQCAHGKTLSFHRTREAMLYVVTAVAAPLTNEAIALADEARREGIATGAVAGLLRAQHGIGMVNAQGTALVLLNALSEMGFKWSSGARGDA